MRAFVKRLISPFLKKAGALYVSRPRKYKYKDISVIVEPGVFPPFLTISTKLLLEFIENQDLKGKTFLELGCGCGIISVLAARKGAFVTSTDINTVALNALKINAISNQVALEILYSDLFDNLHDKTFDIIVINPPYYPKNPKIISENAWFCGENYEYFRKLFTQLKDRSLRFEIVYMILSEDCQIDEIRQIASQHSISFSLVIKKSVLAEQNFIFELQLNKS